MYKLDRKWIITQGIVLLGFSLMVGLVFYDNVAGAVAGFVAIPFIFKQNKDNYIQMQKRIFRKEFKDVIELMSANLNAGYSLENAVVAASNEINKGTFKYKYMNRELAYIVNGMKYSYSVEDLFVKLGEKSEIEEVEEFGGLLSSAKKYGGNIIMLIKQTRDNLTQKSVVEMEIDTTISSKRLEGRVMLVMPFAIIIYMKLTNSSYIDGLYQGAGGRIIMTVIFGLWLLSKCMIDKIVKAVEI